jgi:hypothetical protein
MVVVVLVCPSDLDDETEVDLSRGSACVGVCHISTPRVDLYHPSLNPKGPTYRVRTGFGNCLAECWCRRCENSNPRKHRSRRKESWPSYF